MLKSNLLISTLKKHYTYDDILDSMLIGIHFFRSENIVIFIGAHYA